MSAKLSYLGLFFSVILAFSSAGAELKPNVQYGDFRRQYAVADLVLLAHHQSSGDNCTPSGSVVAQCVAAFQVDSVYKSTSSLSSGSSIDVLVSASWLSELAILRLGSETLLFLCTGEGGQFSTCKQTIGAYPLPQLISSSGVGYSALRNDVLTLTISGDAGTVDQSADCLWGLGVHGLEEELIARLASVAMEARADLVALLVKEGDSRAPLLLFSYLSLPHMPYAHEVLLVNSLWGARPAEYSTSIPLLLRSFNPSLKSAGLTLLEHGGKVTDTSVIMPLLDDSRPDLQFRAIKVLELTTGHHESDRPIFSEFAEDKARRNDLLVKWKAYMMQP